MLLFCFWIFFNREGREGGRGGHGGRFAFFISHGRQGRRRRDASLGFFLEHGPACRQQVERICFAKRGFERILIASLWRDF